MRNRIGVALLTALLLAASATAQKKDLDMDITAPDGAKLKATYYSPGKPGPGMLLLHQCNMDRKSWVSLAGALAERGVHVLAIDYRGYGESAERVDRNDREAMQQIRTKWPADIDAAFAALLAQPGVDKTRVAAGGASCGVNNSVQLARRSGQIKALMLLSGNTNPEGMAFLQQNSNIPVFGAASAEDGNAVPNMKNIVGTSKSAATTIRELNNAGHGVPMFTADPTLLPAIADWLAKVLR